MTKRVPFITGETMTIAAFVAFIASRLLAYGLIVLVPVRVIGPFFGPVCSAVVLLFNQPIDLGLLAIFRRFGLVSGSECRTLPHWLLCHACGRTQQLAHELNGGGVTMEEAGEAGWSAGAAGTRCPFCTTRNL